MLDIEHETLMQMCRLSLTGGECNHTESMAPLICNTANTDYGRLVELKADLFIITHYVVREDPHALTAHWEAFHWTDEYDKIRVDCGSEFLHVYLHENYRESTLENVERLVLAWMKTQEEEL